MGTPNSAGLLFNKASRPGELVLPAGSDPGHRLVARDGRWPSLASRTLIRCLPVGNGFLRADRILQKGCASSDIVATVPDAIKLILKRSSLAHVGL
jgi:hypothetical protein